MCFALSLFMMNLYNSILVACTALTLGVSAPMAHAGPNSRVKAAKTVKAGRPQAPTKQGGTLGDQRISSMETAKTLAFRTFQSRKAVSSQRQTVSEHSVMKAYVNMPGERSTIRVIEFAHETDSKGIMSTVTRTWDFKRPNLIHPNPRLKSVTLDGNIDTRKDRALTRYLEGADK